MLVVVVVVVVVVAVLAVVVVVALAVVLVVVAVSIAAVLTDADAVAVAVPVVTVSTVALTAAVVGVVPTAVVAVAVAVLLPTVVVAVLTAAVGDLLTPVLTLVFAVIFVVELCTTHSTGTGDGDAELCLEPALLIAGERELAVLVAGDPDRLEPADWAGDFLTVSGLGDFGLPDLYKPEEAVVANVTDFGNFDNVWSEVGVDLLVRFEWNSGAIKTSCNFDLVDSAGVQSNGLFIGTLLIR